MLNQFCSNELPSYLQKTSTSVMNGFQLTIYPILQYIDSFGNPVSCGNTEMITEHRLLLHRLFSHHDHLVITKFRSLSGLPPLLYFRIHCPKLSFPLMSISKHHLVPKCICVYYRYLESRQQSFSLILDSCNDEVNQMKYSSQKPDLVVSTSLLLYETMNKHTIG